MLLGRLALWNFWILQNCLFPPRRYLSKTPEEDYDEDGLPSLEEDDGPSPDAMTRRRRMLAAAAERRMQQQQEQQWAPGLSAVSPWSLPSPTIPRPPELHPGRKKNCSSVLTLWLIKHRRKTALRHSVALLCCAVLSCLSEKRAFFGHLTTS